MTSNDLLFDLVKWPQMTEFGLLLGFQFLYIFNILNHLNYDFHFWPLDGANDQKFYHHYSRHGLFSRVTKFHHFTMCLSEIRNFQWIVWEPNLSEICGHPNRCPNYLLNWLGRKWIQEKPGIDLVPTQAYFCAKVPPSGDYLNR